MAAVVDRKIAAAVVAWLEPLKDDSESLAVARACLAEHFGVDDAESSASRSSLAEAVATVTQSATERYEAARADVGDDEAFRELKQAAEKKGFFDGCDADDDEYRKRYVKIYDKYASRQGDKTGGRRGTKPEPRLEKTAPSRDDDDDVARAVEVLARCLEEKNAAARAKALILANRRVVDALLDCAETRTLASNALRSSKRAPPLRSPPKPQHETTEPQPSSRRTTTQTTRR
mmetsp:Transcript_5266/g.17281  ORF Transcript_5266/g.17281 Transcript_5266/m.17281 type:complete len:232 (-) Transcript_5266:246-941(-)